jgi:hypothetical protein
MQNKAWVSLRAVEDIRLVWGRISSPLGKKMQIKAKMGDKKKSMERGIGEIRRAGRKADRT